MKIDVGNIALREEGDGLIISERGSPEMAIAVFLKNGKLHVAGPMNCNHKEMVLEPDGLFPNPTTKAGVTPPSPPAEMPEIDPKTLKYDHCGDSQIPPILTGACIRYGQKVGKKAENSCVGCTVGCTGKGKQVEIIGTDGKVHYRRPEGDPLIQEALSRGLTVREQESK
jgi:hypothetical protein